MLAMDRWTVSTGIAPGRTALRPMSRACRAAAWWLVALPALLASLAAPAVAAAAVVQDEVGATESRAAAPTFHPLRPDAPVEFTTGEADPDTDGGTGRCRLFELTPTRDGLITITAESLDGDAYIRVVAPGPAPRKVLAADDDGGVEWNPRLVVETRAGEPLHLDIGFKVLREGTLAVHVAAGEVPALAGDELERARLAFLRAREPLLQDETSRLNLAQNLNLQTEVLWLMRDWDACLAVGDKLTVLGRELDNALIQMVAEGRAGASLAKRGHLILGVERLRVALDHAVSLRHAAFEMFIQDELGIALLDLDQLDSARAAFTRAHLIARALGDHVNLTEIANDLGDLGTVFEAHGDFQTAADIYEQVAEAGREAGDRNVQAIAMCNIASLHVTLGRLEQAHDVVLEATVLGEDVLSVTNRIQLHLLRADVLRQLGRAEEARAALEDTFETIDSGATVRDRAGLLANLTQLHYVLGDMELATERAEQQIELGRTASNPEVEGIGKNNLAMLELRRGNVARASELASTALELLTEGTDLSLRVSVLGTRVEVALVHGNGGVLSTEVTAIFGTETTL